MNIKKPVTPSSVGLFKPQDKPLTCVYTAEQLAARDAEWKKLYQPVVEALKGLDEAYCRAGSPLSRSERDEDRKRLMAARAALANITEKADQRLI